MTTAQQETGKAPTKILNREELAKWLQDKLQENSGKVFSDPNYNDLNDYIKGMDSLDTIELMMPVQEAFGIQFDDAELADIKTFDKLIDFVYGKYTLTVNNAK